MGKSIADRHLSKSAKYGRYGDTEIIETSSGDIWHVNKEEKKFIENEGLYGEGIVDLIGSGTTNPTTGYEEKFIDPATATFLLNLGKGILDSKSEADKAKETSDQITKSQELLYKSFIDLRESAKKGRESLFDSFTRKFGETGEIFRSKKRKLTKTIGDTIGKQSFAATGTKLGDEEMIDLNKEIKFAFSDIHERAGEQFGSLAADTKVRLAELESEKLSLEQQKKEADATAGQWYLGKNIMNLFS